MVIKALLNGTFKDVGIAILRIGFGLQLAIAHGYPTVKAFLGGTHDYPDPLGLGTSLSMGLMGFTELICGSLVALGLYLRLALIPLIFGFAIAFFVFHGTDPFQTKELAFHYLLAFLVLALTGPGQFTITELFKKKSL